MPMPFRDAPYFCSALSFSSDLATQPSSLSSNLMATIPPSRLATKRDSPSGVQARSDMDLDVRSCKITRGLDVLVFQMLSVLSCRADPRPHTARLASLLLALCRPPRIDHPRREHPHPPPPPVADQADLALPP